MLTRLQTLFRHSCLLILLSISLFCGMGKTAACFNDQLPSFIQQEETKRYGDMRWLSMIISSDYNTLFVGGESASKKLFTSAPNQDLAIAGRFSITDNEYVWAKAFVDDDDQVEAITGLALNYAESVLAIASDAPDNKIVLFFLSPETGEQLYDSYKITLEDNLYILSSQSMLMAGASRLYVTGRSWDAPKNYKVSKSFEQSDDTNEDTFQLMVFDYASGQTFLNHYSKGNSQFGVGTGSCFVDSKRSEATANGEEAVLMGGGHSSGSSLDEWVLGLYSINAGTGQVTANVIKYNDGSYFQSSAGYQFIQNMDLHSSGGSYKLYFTSTSRQYSEELPGFNSNICSVTFTDSTFTEISGSPSCAQSLDDDNSNKHILSLKYANSYYNMVVKEFNEVNFLRVSSSFTDSEMTTVAYKHLRGWAAVIGDLDQTESTSVSSGSPRNLYQGYYAGQQEKFDQEYYLGLPSTETLKKTAAVIDAILESETCRASDFKNQAWALTITSTVIFENSATPLSFSPATSANCDQSDYDTYDLDFSKVVIDNLCGQTSSSYTAENPTSGGFTIDSQLYYISNAQGSVQIGELSDGVTCDEADIEYSMSINPADIGDVFISFDEDNRIVSWESSEIDYAGIYTIKITATSITQDSGNYIGLSTSFDLVVSSDACSISSEEIDVEAGDDVGDQTYTVTGLNSFVVIPDFTVSDAETCEYITLEYTLIVQPKTPGADDKTFISWDLATMTVTWSSATNDNAGLYRIGIKGQVERNDPQSFKDKTWFYLTIVELQCYDSVDTFQILGPDLTDLSYNVNSGIVDIIVISDFTVNNSGYCEDSDIVYSMTVTGETFGADTSFITFDSGLMTVTWSSDTNADAGIYKVDIIGLITRDSLPIESTSSFTLTIVELECYDTLGALQLSNTGPTAMSYSLTSLIDTSVTFDTFVETSTDFCDATEMTYTFFAVTAETPGQDTSFIILDPINMIADWTTSDKANGGVFTIQLQVQIIRALDVTTETFDFVLRVQNCVISIDTPFEIVKGIDLATQSYTQTQDSGTESILINAFTVISGIDCGQDDIVYSISVEPYSSFITFNQATMTVTWATTDTADVGQYTVDIVGTITRNDFSEATDTSSFVLNVLSNSFNLPVLENLDLEVDNNGQVTYLMEDLANLDDYELDFGLISDVDGDSVTIVSIMLQNYFEFDSESGLLYFDYKGLMDTAIGVGELIYEVQLTLTDSQGGITVYQIFFVVPIDESLVDVVVEVTNTTSTTTFNQTESTNNTTKPTFDSFNYDQSEGPYWKSITINNKGRVKIQFSENMVIPQNLSNIDSDMLNVTLKLGGYVDEYYLDYTWNITEFTKTYFVVQLNFENPIYVSSKGTRKGESIVVSVQERNLFISETSLKVIRKDEYLIKPIPPQLTNNTAENRALEVLTGVISVSTKTVAIGAFIINILLAMSLSLLWGMVNALQIIGHLVFFEAYIPASALSFFNPVLELAEFNVLPVDDIVNWLINYDGEEDLIFHDLGPFFIFLMLGLVLVVILILLYPCRYITDSISSLYFSVRHQIFWNASILYIIEGHMELTLASLVAINAGLDWSEGIQSWASLFSIVTFAVCQTVPILITLFFIRNFSQFRKRTFLERFDQVIGTMSFRNKLSPWFVSIFCYRRLVQVLLIIYCKQYPYLQIQLQTLLGIFVIHLFGASSSMYLPRDRQLEFFNEASILLCVYHLYLFTDFVDNPIIRYKVGYSFIGCTCANIMVNVFVLMKVTVESLFFSCKRSIYKRRNRNLVKKYQKNKKKNANRITQQLVEERAEQQQEVVNQPNPNNNHNGSQQQLSVIDELPSEVEQVSSHSMSPVSKRKRSNFIPVMTKSSQEPAKVQNFQGQSQLLLSSHQPSLIVSKPKRSNFLPIKTKSSQEPKSQLLNAAETSQDKRLLYVTKESDRIMAEFFK